MALYEYEQLGSRNGAGGSAVVEAPDRAAAIRTLRERGITPVRMVEVVERRRGARGACDVLSTGQIAVGEMAGEISPGRKLGGWGSGGNGGLGGGGKPRVGKAELSAMLADLTTALGAGLTLLQALRTIQQQTRRESMRSMLGHLINEVEHGRTFADAAESWGSPFGELLVGLIRAGEQTGRLNEVLAQASTLLDRDLKLRRNLAMGMLYPAILAVLIAAAVVVVVTVVVPKLLAPLAGRVSFAQLPWPTRVVMGVTEFFGANWLFIVAGLAVLVVVARQMYAQPQTRLSIDRAILRMPAIGRLANDIAVARFSRTMGTLVGSGLPVLASLRGAMNTLGNRAMREAVAEVAEGVQSGKTIAEPLERTGLFPPMLTQIVGIGERSGRLGEMMERAAGVFEERSENSLKVVTTLVPPVLVVMAAVVVGFVVLAVLMALLEVQRQIG